MTKQKASYDISFKLKAVKYAEEHNKEGAAQHFKVDAKWIRKWCNLQKAMFREVKKKGNSSRKRLKGGGRKADDAEMEEEWIVGMRQQNLRVSLRMIQLKGRELSNSECSRGWLYRFLNSKGWRRTTLAQTTPADCIPKLVNFILHLRHLMIKSSFTEQKWIRLHAGWICLQRPQSYSQVRVHASENNWK